jgi:hypothetical protein
LFLAERRKPPGSGANACGPGAKNAAAKNAAAKNAVVKNAVAKNAAANTSVRREHQAASRAGRLTPLR